MMLPMVIIICDDYPWQKMGWLIDLLVSWLVGFNFWVMRNSLIPLQIGMVHVEAPGWGAGHCTQPLRPANLQFPHTQFPKYTQGAIPPLLALSFGSKRISLSVCLSKTMVTCKTPYKHKHSTILSVLKKEPTRTNIRDTRGPKLHLHSNQQHQLEWQRWQESHCFCLQPKC